MEMADAGDALAVRPMPQETATIITVIERTDKSSMLEPADADTDADAPRPIEITEAADVAMLREQDALAVARAHALVQEDQEQPPVEPVEDTTGGQEKQRVSFKSQQKSESQSGSNSADADTRDALAAMIALTATDTSGGIQDAVQYEPLRAQWHYGQAVLARFKKTPYFYSGNIATYLGAGLFMIVFDDGSLDYRVKREDIVLRAPSTMPSSSEDVSEGDDESQDTANQRITWYRTDVYLSDKPVMVDFSVSPPRQTSAGRVGYEVPDDAWLGAKHLECGVAYEDDSTQVSDSDDSIEEDMTMTPWQQMTQTFGMGMGHVGGARHHKQRGSTRRSSVSSLSQIERLSISGKSMNQIIPSPKGIKQTIQDYLAKKTKKVQPSTVSSDPASEIIRKMQVRREELRSHEGRRMSFASPGRASPGRASPRPSPIQGTVAAAPTSSKSNTGAGRTERSRSTTGSFFMGTNGSNGRDRSVSAASAAASASFTVTTIGSMSGAAASMPSMAASDASSIGRTSPSTTRVVFQRESDGVRVYGTVMSRLANGDYEVVAESDQSIVVHALPGKDLDFLPSLKELDAQIQDLQNQGKKLYAGRKVQVNLYPGTRFSGPGVIILEDDSVKMSSTASMAGRQTSSGGCGGVFNVLLQNRIRLLNVPEDKIVPFKEKRKEPVRITEDQFLVCHGKTKVHIGDQVFVKCEGENEDQIEEKLGVLNGVYSNRTAAIDFADGSTGYEIAPGLITKHKRLSMAEDMDLMSLKNAVLMQAAMPGSEGLQVDVGYQVKADHPRRASVESCVVVRKHSSTACDVRFADGTISFGVFPSQMVIDTCAMGAAMDKAPSRYEAAVGDVVLAWSSRFMRFCSAIVSAKNGEGAAHVTYTIVFDYGELKDQMPSERIASIDDADALSPTQKLTNYTFDTIGFEIQPVTFMVGEAVMARVHGSMQYYNGWVEAVSEKDRTCTVVFDSSERDEQVKFSSMFSVDVRNRFRTFGQQTCSGSSTGVAVNAADDNASSTSGVSPGRDRRRHSASSVGSIIMSVAGSIFQAKKKVERLERRGSALITEVGARKLQMHVDDQG